MPDKRYRAFCFTLNNYKPADVGAVQNLKGTTYGIVGEEGLAPGKTPHLQGYVYFKCNKTLKAMIKQLRKVFAKAPHVEPAAGTAKQSQAYCSKEGKFAEWGELPSQGKRRDLEHAAEMLKAGEAMSAVAEEHPGTYIRYHKGLEKYQGLQLKAKAAEWRAVEVVLIKGPTGTGKTRMAMEEAKYKIDGCGLQWWDGYEGEDCILIDEYANNVKITELLTVLDGHPKRLAIKGGFTYACWTKVYITTNLRQLHELASAEHKAALERRITKTLDLYEAEAHCCSYTGTLACDCFFPY